jgi:hypothetical protein
LGVHTVRQFISVAVGVQLEKLQLMLLGRAKRLEHFSLAI